MKACTNCKNNNICSKYDQVRAFPASNVKNQLPKYLHDYDREHQRQICDKLMGKFADIYFEETESLLAGDCENYWEIGNEKPNNQPS